MKPVRLDEEAETEIAETFAWYEGQRENLGQELLETVDEAIEALKERPASFARAAGVSRELGVRRALLRRFPFSLVFIELEGEIRVLAFAHGRRRPAYWRGRLRH
jgi:toxin ParE1/3/4